jgi:hypothetical protein
VWGWDELGGFENKFGKVKISWVKLKIDWNADPLRHRKSIINWSKSIIYLKSR